MGVKAVRIEVRFLIDDVLLKLDVRCKKNLYSVGESDAGCSELETMELSLGHDLIGRKT